MACHIATLKINLRTHETHGNLCGSPLEKSIADHRNETGYTIGGMRGNGTNDKAGFYLNLLRWTSPRTIKENLLPPRRYDYPFMAEA